jgi:hypothetical protein
MKLHQAILDLQEDIPFLNEIRSEHFDNLEWISDNPAYVAIGTWRDEVIRISIEPNVISVQEKTYVWLNIGFSRQITQDGKPVFTQVLLKTTSQQTTGQLLGYIINALKPKIKELTEKYDIAGIAFAAAADEADRRLKAYASLVSHYGDLRKYTAYDTTVKIKGGEAIMYLKKDLPSLTPFIDDLKKNGKIV